MEIFDTLAETTYYQSHFYIGENFQTGAALNKTLKWLMPAYFTASIYEVRISVRDWIASPSDPSFEYGKILVNMAVSDIITQ